MTWICKAGKRKNLLGSSGDEDVMEDWWADWSDVLSSVSPCFSLLLVFSYLSSCFLVFFFLLWLFSWEALLLVFIGDEDDGDEDVRLLVELDTLLCFFFFFFLFWVYLRCSLVISSPFFFSLFVSVFLWSSPVFYFFSYLICPPICEAFLWLL